MIKKTPKKTPLLEIWKNLKNPIKIGIISIPILIILIMYFIFSNSNTTSVENFVEPTKDYEVELVKNEDVLDTVKEDENLNDVVIPEVSDLKVNSGESFYEEGLVEDSSIDSALFIFDASKVNKTQASNFIERFLNTAITEKYIFGIPICMTLAQGIIESNHGKSRLAKGYNNFFGIKCKKACKNCDGKGSKISDDKQCVNFEDDSKDDYFKIFKTPWESFRYRSMLLKSAKRYEELFKIDNDATKNPDFYVDWSNGLKKAGYATSPKYHKTLKNVIERLGLNQYDEMNIFDLAKQRGIDLNKIDKSKILPKK